MTLTPQEIKEMLASMPPLEYRHVAITGPSGSGKSTIIKKDSQSILKIKPDHFDFSISGATRAPRGNEVNGVDYFFFSSNEDFQRKKFVETNEYEGNSRLYGTLYSEVVRICFTGKKSLGLDIDINGGKRMKEIFRNNLLWVFLKTPPNELYGRLKDRQPETGETDAQIDARIVAAEKELKLVEDKIMIPDFICEYDNSMRPAMVANEVIVRASFSLPLAVKG